MESPDTYLKVIDTQYDPSIHGEYEGDFEKEHFGSKYPWDSFQIHAFQAIKRGDNVLVVAPTSSGKTSVAKYASMFNLLTKDVKVVYTTPTKSLSDEKYAEMKEILSPYSISPGLLTGDKKIDVDSRFLIMTAEILANALFMLKQGDKVVKNQYNLDRDFVKSIGCVIMDEIHMISDKSRGYVWENTLILLNPSVQIVGLSATISKPENFASWIGRTKMRAITLVKKYDRPVPLEYTIYDGAELKPVMGADGTYYAESFRQALKSLKEEEKRHEERKTNKMHALLNGFIQYAKEKELMQLCFIVFSKKNCEKFAETVSVNLMSGAESALATRELERKMGVHLKSYETMPRYRQIKDLIQKGVCFHHAGLPVIMKEVVEHMFKAGHIKVLFATETVAIGVNMPIRTLVLTSVEKNVGRSMQPINASEFKQICGRAGRRGLDTKGVVVFLPLYTIPSEMLIHNDLLFGQMPTIESRMELTPHSYLKLLMSEVMDRDAFYADSLLNLSNRSYIDHVSTKIAEHSRHVNEASSALQSYLDKNNISDAVIESLREYIDIKSKQSDMMNGAPFQIKPSKQQLKNQKKLEDTARANKQLYDLMMELNGFVNSLKDADTDLRSVATYSDSRFDLIKQFLMESDYITSSDEPTEYGKIAAMINECNPFILAEIFTGNILGQLTPVQIICLLSIFADKINRSDRDDATLKSIQVESVVKDAVAYIEERVSSYVDLENTLKLYSEEGYWEISYDYMELAKVWAETDVETEGHGQILAKLNEADEYEGSFIKNMLKINNIVGNLMTLCQQTQQMAILPALQEIERLLIKGFVNVDSLHVAQ